MTAEELAQVPFEFVCSIAMEHEHTTTLKNDEYDMGYCLHTIKRADGGFGRSYRHYRYRDKIYKTLPKFLEAIKDVKFKEDNSCKVIQLNKKL